MRVCVYDDSERTSSLGELGCHDASEDRQRYKET